MERLSRPVVIIAAFAASLAVGLLLMTWLMGDLKKIAAPAAIGGPFRLTDQSGQAVTEQNLKGRPTLIFFGFTHCPDVCPTSLFEISEVLRAMGKDVDKVNAYFVSVDPERDKPEVLKAYLSAFGPRFVGLTGTEEEIAATAKAYRVYVQSHKDEGANYTVDHSGVVYLMDKSGAFLANYSLDASPDKLAADLTKQTIN